MGLARGSETLSLHNTYIFVRLQRVIAVATHAILFMPDPTTRSTATKNPVISPDLRYYITAAYASVLILFSTVLDVTLFICTAIELCIVLLISPIGALLYPLTRREDSINTLLSAIESVFVGLEIQKLNTVAYIDYQVGLCEDTNKCGEVVSFLHFRVVRKACRNCCSLVVKLQELNVDRGKFSHVTVRNGSVWEYCPLTHISSRVIDEEGLKSLRRKQFRVLQTYDTRQFKWKCVFVASSEARADQLTYKMSGVRTEQLTTVIKTEEEYTALKSFSVASKDWNRLSSKHYNHQTRQFIKVAGPAVLLVMQMTVGLLQLDDENNVTLNSLAILITCQLLWFQVLSEVLLADVPGEVIEESNFERVSVARARAIRYVDNGDQDGVFSNENLSWGTGITFIGNGMAKAVLPIELLLNANRFVSTDELYNFSQTGITVYKQSISTDVEEGSVFAKVNSLKEYTDCRQLSRLPKVNFSVR